MTWTIEALDTSSDAAIEAFCAARLAAEEHDFAWHTAYSTAETIVSFRASQNSERRVILQAIDDEQVLGVAAAELPLLDNISIAHVGVAVIPSARRQGVGSALLEALVQEARAADRTRITGYHNWAYLADADDHDRSGSASPGMHFVIDRGFSISQLQMQRLLELPVPAGVLDELEAHAAEHHEGYTFRTWIGAAPQDLLPGYGRLVGAVETEAPTGELSPEPEVWDEARLRETERQLVDQQRTRVTTMALSPAGEPVGFTEMVHAATNNGRVYQWGTLVDRDHRGHRLGTALKVRTTRVMQERFPDAPYVRTWNAESNGPMITVNDALGFRPVGWEAEIYRDL